MATLENLDPTTPLPAQLREKTGPVVLAETFLVPAERTEEFLRHWRAMAAFMKEQPGCLSLRMHRGTAGSRLLMNIAAWESTEAIARAQQAPEFGRLAAALPDDVVVHLHLFERIAVDGICDAAPDGPGQRARPPAGRRLARFNRAYANRVVGPVLTRMPGFGTVLHRGRTSGRTYGTPVKVFRSGDRYIMALPYGPRSDWARNVVAAQGCELVVRGRRVRLAEPRIYVDREQAGIPVPIRAVLRRLGCFDFIELRPAERRAHAAE
ncbi:nitroreductase/quinone reductase family protein [Streptomyces sp. I05A-00742]|uniref:nitroreductase/quinone reductase family protein n=1 Tax=Streptomyces sp. I05A-00742 TaxID=2732853 RepID=UPI0028991B16|nr:nitroreductase/quinone reductase family protein [Streptomyces sp. I05A-00742]